MPLAFSLHFALNLCNKYYIQGPLFTLSYLRSLTRNILEPQGNLLDGNAMNETALSYSNNPEMQIV